MHVSGSSPGMVELAVCGEADELVGEVRGTREPSETIRALRCLDASRPAHASSRMLLALAHSAYAPATAPRPPARAPAARMATTVFIDGQAGTTGLQVRGSPSGAATLKLITLPEDNEADAAARRRRSTRPTPSSSASRPAAIEAASLVEAGNDRTVLIDVDGAPDEPGVGVRLSELDVAAREDRRAEAHRQPRLLRDGVHCADRAAGRRRRPRAVGRAGGERDLGYSGGGNPLIDVFEGGEPHEPWGVLFALDHKHLPEMQVFSGPSARRSSCRRSARLRRGWWSRCPSTTTATSPTSPPAATSGRRCTPRSPRTTRAAASSA